MMEIQKGSIVFSKAGRDKGKFMAVADVTQNGIWVVDGKERPIEKPKMKNPKHLSPTKTTIKNEEMEANSRLRKALKRFAEKASEEGDV